MTQHIDSISKKATTTQKEASSFDLASENFPRLQTDSTIPRAGWAKTVAATIMMSLFGAGAPATLNAQEKSGPDKAPVAGPLLPAKGVEPRAGNAAPPVEGPVAPPRAAGADKALNNPLQPGQAAPLFAGPKKDPIPDLIAGPSTHISSPAQVIELIKRGTLLPTVVEYENHFSGSFSYEFQVKPELAGRKKSVRLIGINNNSPDRTALLEAMQAAGMSVEYKPQAIEDGRGGSWLANNATSLLFFGAMIGLTIWMLRRMGSTNSMTNADAEVVLPGKLKDRFKDIGGLDHVIDELRELKAKIEVVQKGDLRISLPRGNLLFGPPGSGKTKLVRTLAGELDAPFIKFDCSQLSTSLYVGSGVARVSNAFGLARKLRDMHTEYLRKLPGATGKEEGVAFLVLDEFESIGLRRTDGTDVGRGDTEHLKVVNTLLNEMDGFNQERNKNIIVFACTNNPSTLDPALLRPGRFTRRIAIDIPRSPTQRLEIFKALEQPILTSRGFTVEDPKSLEYIAKITPGKSGDHLRQILVEASELAQIDGRNALSQADLFEAAQRADMGRLQRNYLSPERHAQVAHHEHGHSLAALSAGIGIFLVSMLPRGESAGRIYPDPEGLAESIRTMNDYLTRIFIGAGGRAAEWERYGKNGVSDGAISDIEQIQELVATMISVGMLDDLYSMNLRRLPTTEWKAEHHQIINQIATRAVEFNRQVVRAAGSETMETLVRDSLAQSEELVADKAMAFYQHRIEPAKFAKMQEIFRQYLADPLGTQEKGVEKTAAASPIGESSPNTESTSTEAPPPPTFH